MEQISSQFKCFTARQKAPGGWCDKQARWIYIILTNIGGKIIIPTAIKHGKNCQE